MTITEQEERADVPPLGPAPADPDQSGNPARIAQLLVGLALIAALLALLGWGYLLLFIVILVAIVMLHEFGHFATAKWAGMKVTEYFVGFGPRLWSVRRGETEYGVKAIPAGGYVRITGFTSTEEVAEEDEARAYRQQPFHQRIIVASAGSAMHFLIALVLALIVVLGFGQLTNNYTVAALEHWTGKTTPAQLAGLQGGRHHRIHKREDVRHAQGDERRDQGRDAQAGHAGVSATGGLMHETATPESGQGVRSTGRSWPTADTSASTGRGHRDGERRCEAPGAASSNLWSATSRKCVASGRSSRPAGSRRSGIR